MVKDSVKFLVDTMLKQDINEKAKPTEDNSVRLSEKSTETDEKPSSLCLC